MPCNCGHVTVPSPTPCSRCNTVCSVPECNPCPPIPAATPMVQCEAPEYCSEGCVETLKCDCVVYNGLPLTTIGIAQGDSLCRALSNINAILAQLVMGVTTVPNYVYEVRCLANQNNPISLVTLTKNGVSQIVGPTQYSNAASALAFLQTVDPAWTFTAPNKFSIHSAHTWVLGMSCPA